MTAKIFVFHIWLTGTVTLLNSLTEFQELFDEIAMKLVEFFWQWNRGWNGDGIGSILTEFPESFVLGLFDIETGFTMHEIVIEFLANGRKYSCNWLPAG